MQFRKKVAVTYGWTDRKTDMTNWQKQTTKNRISQKILSAYTWRHVTGAAFGVHLLSVARDRKCKVPYI